VAVGAGHAREFATRRTTMPHVRRNLENQGRREDGADDWIGQGDSGCSRVDSGRVSEWEWEWEWEWECLQNGLCVVLSDVYVFVYVFVYVAIFLFNYDLLEYGMGLFGHSRAFHGNEQRGRPSGVCSIIYT